MIYRVRHFKPPEFKCPCCGEIRAAADLVFWLEVFRRVLGLPLRVNSGFRCAKHNAEVGGVELSRHLLGCAVDIAKPEGVSYETFSDIARGLFGYPDWEVKLYASRTYIHVAVPRDYRTRQWHGEEFGEW